jgi:hypothetical protein
VAHVYASVAEADDYTTSGGAAKFATQPASTVALKLGILEAVSRVIDADMGRSFGPRIGTNRYNGSGRTYLRLGDDLQTITSITIRPSTGSATTTVLAADTDYYALDEADGYSGPPYRRVLLNGSGTGMFGAGFRVTDIVGVWGYSNVTVPTGVTVASGLAVDATATTFTTSASPYPALSPGMTLLIGTEQLYLTGLTGTAATVVRGANGTTAAVHADASTIARYVYDSRVHEVTLRLYQRRWKARDAGADGSDGGMNVPSTSPHESEDTIIRRGLFGLQLRELV